MLKHSPLYALICISLLQGADPMKLPLFKMEDMEFIGGFRVSAEQFGHSSMNYAPGAIAYHPVRRSVFLAGHDYQDAIAEFALPEIVNSRDLSKLKISAEAIQSFTNVLDRPTGEVVQDINTIGGMAVVGNELIVNAYEYYDAPGDNTVSTLVLRNANDIKSCKVDGYFHFTGAGAAHHARWISPVPAEWVKLVGGDYIVGSSSGDPIIGRWPVGPSAFSFNVTDIVGAHSKPETISTRTLLDYSLKKPISEDLSNELKTNDIWTHITRATYGLIVPGTRSYLVLGHTGGHKSGVCYKCTQNNGRKCGGYCAPDTADYTQYYWAYDMRDLLAVNAGSMLPHEAKPYAYGEFNTPFQGSVSNGIGGGSYDAATGRVFLTVQRADNLQGRYSNPPVIAVYRFKTAASAPGALQERHLPFKMRLTNTGTSGRTVRIDFSLNNSQTVTIEVFDTQGTRMGKLFQGPLKSDIPYSMEMDGTGFPPILILRITGESFKLDKKLFALP